MAILPPTPPTYYSDSTVDLYHGDCLDILRELPDASVDSVCCDPPYGLSNTSPQQVADTLVRWVNGDRDYIPTGSGFMGRPWDAFVPPVAVWDECLRVLKPGGHVLAFAGSRTHDLMTLALRLAGFEIRDSVAWLYGSGFPKSLDVSKAIDKHFEPKPEVDLTLEYRFTGWARSLGITAKQIDEATASNMGGHYPTAASQPAIPTRAMLERLRPLLGDVPDWVERAVDQREQEKAEARARQEAARFLATLQAKNAERKVEHSDAERWQGWGTALKPAFEPIVMGRKPLDGTVAANALAHGTGALNIDGCRVGDEPLSAHGGGPAGDHRIYNGDARGKGIPPQAAGSNPRIGRWPANVILDESQADVLDEQSGTLTSGKMLAGTKPKGERETYGQDAASGYETARDTPGDSGGASRFFYVAKADASERVRVDGIAHPTVKPLSIMRWLVRLVTPEGGTVLEPFAGSGTTVEACILEGFRCVAIEREADYLPLIQQRIHRRRDPVAAVKATGDDGGLFDLLGEATA